MQGRVVSTKMQKTVSVLVTHQKTHPLYKKSFTRTKKYLVDDPIGVHLGDLVEFIKIRPISKNKHWQITKTIGRSMTEIMEEQLKEQAKQQIEEVMPEEPAELVDQNINESDKKEGGKQIKVVTSKSRTKSVQK